MAISYKKEFFGEWARKNKIKKEELKKVLGTSSANNLQLWMCEREPEPLKDGSTDYGDRAWLPLRNVLKLCNYYGLKLSDFFENADDPPLKKRRERREAERSSDAALRQELLEQRINHLQELDLVKTQACQREDDIRRDYEKKLEDLQAMMQQTIDAQREIIVGLRDGEKKDGTDRTYPIAAEP